MKIATLLSILIVVTSDFSDVFHSLNPSIWMADNNSYKCNEHFGSCSGAISNPEHIEFKRFKTKEKETKFMELWMYNDCQDLTPGSRCCPEKRPCTTFTAGTVQSKSKYGHGAFSFMGKPTGKRKTKRPLTPGSSHIDVFIIREGASTAQSVRHLVASGGYIDLKDGSRKPAREFEAICQESKLPYMDVTNADCDFHFTDARLSRAGLSQAEALYTHFPQWARSSAGDLHGSRTPYQHEDGFLMISPLRRAAVTAMMPFKDNLEDMCIEVEFDLRELQHSYMNGLFRENDISEYPHDLQRYFLKMHFAEVHVNYMSDIYDQIEGKVIDTYDKDGCPTNPNFFKRKIQNMARAASTRKKKYIVMGTHGNVIKCMNREFHLQQTGGVHDESNPFFRFGWHLIGNGAVERVTWDTSKEEVVGDPTFVWRGWHVYAVDQAKVWKVFNSNWPKPQKLPSTANGQGLQEPLIIPNPVQKDFPSISCFALTGKIGYNDFEISSCFSSENTNELHTTWGFDWDVRRTTVDLGFDASKVLALYTIDWKEDGISWKVNHKEVAHTSLKSNNPSAKAKISMYIRPLNMERQMDGYEPNSISQRFEIYGAGYASASKDELIVIGSRSHQSELRITFLMGIVLLFCGGFYICIISRRNKSIPDGYALLEEFDNEIG